MKITIALLVAAVLCLPVTMPIVEPIMGPIVVPMAHAQRELFETPSQAYSWQQAVGAVSKRAFNNGVLNQLEPASGAPAAAAATAPPTAAGNSAAPKSPASKDAGSPPPLPTVRIGSQTVQRNQELMHDAETASTPASLQRKDYSAVLGNRLAFTAFAHSPRRGSPSAPLTVVVFEDLSCISCTATSKNIGVVLQDVLAPNSAITTATTSGTLVSTSLISLTQVVWVHAAANRWQSTNLPAFYSKVAADYGKFWQFRAALLEAPDRSPSTLFGLLAGLGIDPRTIRQTMLTEARRYYRELDNDLLQARSFGISAPPTVLVNGIRVGEGGLPLANLPEALSYVQNRYNAGLAEPPR